MRDTTFCASLVYGPQDDHFSSDFFYNYTFFIGCSLSVPIHTFRNLLRPVAAAVILLCFFQSVFIRLIPPDTSSACTLFFKYAGPVLQAEAQGSIFFFSPSDNRPGSAIFFSPSDNRPGSAIFFSPSDNRPGSAIFFSSSDNHPGLLSFSVLRTIVRYPLSFSIFQTIAWGPLSFSVFRNTVRVRYIPLSLRHLLTSAVFLIIMRHIEN